MKKLFTERHELEVGSGLAELIAAGRKRVAEGQVIEGETK